MIYFLLPQVHPLIFRDICIDVRDSEPQIAVSHSLCNYMNELKEKISTRDKEWDVYKKYTNPYEYIHSLVPHKKKAVSKYKPISRSYFKMIEIISEFQIIPPSLAATGNASPDYVCDSSVVTSRSFDSFELFSSNSHSTTKWSPHKSLSCLMTNTPLSPSAPFTFPVEPPPRSPSFGSGNGCRRSSPIRTFHLAEGPGGFIEAVCNRRNNREDNYYGMTILIDEYDDNVPAWNKTGNFLAQHANVHIETGADGTGNLLHIENYDYCVAKYGGTMDLVTADGGFDFSKDFNKQEVSITKLLWGQVCYALALQRRGGNFVLKIFDCFYEHTIDILYILSSFYSEVIISKLQTSRVGNSEKYVVCKGFRFATGGSTYTDSFSSSAFLSNIRDSFQKICVEINPFSSASRYVWRLLSKPVPRHFTKQIEDMNAIFGQQQIENIHYTISLIDKQSKTEKSDQIIRQHINKCVNWCIEHEIPYNNLINNNTFVNPAATFSEMPSSRILSHSTSTSKMVVTESSSEFAVLH